MDVTQKRRPDWNLIRHQRWLRECESKDRSKDQDIDKNDNFGIIRRTKNQQLDLTKITQKSAKNSTTDTKCINAPTLFG